MSNPVSGAAIRGCIGHAGRLLVGLLFGLWCGCSKPTAAPSPPDAAPSSTASEGVPPTAAKRSTKRSGSRSPSAGPAAKESPKPLSVLARNPPKIADDDLRTEEPEANPYSETVTLRLAVTPQVKALVMWGGKQVAKLAPGNMDAEIVRPRGSGPIDLEIKAEGYMPYHSRLYSDRDDKINVRLYRPEEAPGLFGFRRATSATETEKKK